MNDKADSKPPTPIASSEPNPNLAAPASAPTPSTAEETTASTMTEEPAVSSRTLSQEERENIIALYQSGHAVRKITPLVGRDRKTVRRVLQEAGLSLGRTSRSPRSTSKLQPFLPIVREKAAQRLTQTRILREIRELGYKGGRTILADHIRTLPTTAAPNVAKRRFETPIGAEMQVDWSVFT